MNGAFVKVKSPINPARISVDNEGMPWITTESGYVYRYLGNDLYNDYDDLGWVRYELYDAMDISNGLDGQV